MTLRHRLFATLAFAAALTTAQAFAAPTAAAEDGYLVFNTFAYHFENSDKRNDFTPGIGWEYSPTSGVGFHVGTLSDSFGYQAKYGGVNYATRAVFGDRVRFIIGATLLHKQYKVDADPETKLLPLPAVEVKIAERAVLNVSGSPAVDYAGQKNNAVVWFQLKLGML